MDLKRAALDPAETAAPPAAEPQRTALQHIAERIGPAALQRKLAQRAQMRRQAAQAAAPQDSAAPGKPVQRMVAIRDNNDVYAPTRLKPEDGGELTRFGESIKALVGGAYSLKFMDEGKFTDDIIKTGFTGQEAKFGKDYFSKYQDPQAARDRTSEASIAQDQAKTFEERQKATTDLAGQLDDIGHHHLYDRYMAARSEFAREDAVFEYKSAGFIKKYEQAQEHLLLSPHDMKEAGDPLPTAREASTSCVLDSISDLGENVRQMWSDLPSSTDVDAWHRACRAKNLDYRTDSQYIKLYAALGYKLISNTPTTWEAFDIAHRGDGSYVVATGGGGIGHMIAVRVAGGVATVLDRQGLTKPSIDKRERVDIKLVYKK